VAGPARPRFLDGFSDEKLWDVVVALSTELAATRARLDTLERVLTEQHRLPADALEAWQPSVQAGIERTQDLQEYTRRVFGSIGRE
jgi:hypothetical protein